MIRTIVIQNFKTYEHVTIDLQPTINILVGNNEAGKSTVLEAIHLALTARIGRIPIIQCLSANLLNRSVAQKYIEDLHAGKKPVLPEIVIELYFESTPTTTSLKGTNNLRKEDTGGVRLWIHFDNDYATEYAEYLKDPKTITSIPMEYYKVEWLAFSGSSITQRSLKISATLIDASKIRLQNGADYYLQRIIQEGLSDAERVRLARTYSELKQTFANSDGIKALNEVLDQRKANITDKSFTLGMDTSPYSVWEASLVPHLDDVPFGHAGGGEQSMMKILLAITRNTDGSHIVLIEEPENHLSYPRLNNLVEKIGMLCAGRQVVLTTHSSFVLNKLGLKNLLLLKKQAIGKLTDLPEDTQEYFKKLSGYDTLRMVLSDKVILVEGPSDDLIVQRAFRDTYNVLPILRGIDVIEVRGLAFKRFLDIAAITKTKVAVITDNDADLVALKRKYKAYEQYEHLKICYGADPNHKTLEPQLVACNKLDDLNTALGTTHTSTEVLLESISVNKTEAALKIFESPHKLAMPDYITQAITWLAQ